MKLARAGYLTKLHGALLCFSLTLQFISARPYASSDRPCKLWQLQHSVQCLISKKPAAWRYMLLPCHSLRPPSSLPILPSLGNKTHGLRFCNICRSLQPQHSISQALCFASFQELGVWPEPCECTQRTLDSQLVLSRSGHIAAIANMGRSGHQCGNTILTTWFQDQSLNSSSSPSCVQRQLTADLRFNRLPTKPMLMSPIRREDKSRSHSGPLGSSLPLTSGASKAIATIAPVLHLQNNAK